MSRKLAAIVLVLGGAVFGIVQAQERTSAPDLKPPVVRGGDDEGSTGTAPGRWRSVGDSKDGEGIPELPPVGTGTRFSASDEANEPEDGLRSVLKRRTTTPVETKPAPSENALDDTATGSSRRGTPQLESTSPVTQPIRPSYSTRTPAAGVPSSRDGGATIQNPNSVLARGQTPSVRVETVGPAAVVVGKPTTYRVFAINESTESAREVMFEIGMPGSVTLDGVTASVGDAKPAPGSGLTWRIPSLAGGAREQLEIQLTPQTDQLIQLTMDWTLRAASLTATVEVQKPALEVQITGPEDILYGARQIYTITISNPGTGPADDVSLDVSTGGNGQARRIGTIAPGAQQQIRMELVARESGTLEIKATAHGDGLRNEAIRKILVRRAELAVDVVGPGLKFAGSTGTYDVKIENVGNAAASDVEVSVKMPSGARYVAGLEGATETAGRLTWKINELAAQDLRKYSIEVAYEKAGELQCEVHAAAAGELASTAQCLTTVEALADLKLVVNDPQGPKSVGEDVVFEIRVINRGTKAAQSVSVLGQFSDGVEPVRVEGGTAELVTGQVIFRELPRVEAGQTVTLKIVARADKAGNHRFRAVLKCEDPDTELIAEDMTRFFGDSISTTASKDSAKRR